MKHPDEESGDVGPYFEFTDMRNIQYDSMSNAIKDSYATALTWYYKSYFTEAHI